MSAKDQFETFKLFFQWEEDRSKSLTETGKVYLTLISLFFAYLGYKISDTQFLDFIQANAFPYPIEFLIYALVFSMLLLSLILTVVSLFVHDYEQIGDPQDLFDESVAADYTTDEFFDLITTNMNITTRVNSGINDSRAEKLRWASVCLVVGFALYGVMFLMAAWQKAG